MIYLTRGTKVIQLNIKKKKTPKKKKTQMGKGPEQTFFQRRYTDGQQTHEKMLNNSNHQGNANQNHSEL